jgi:transcriptional regulator with XRE-family HTH domain
MVAAMTSVTRKLRDLRQEARLTVRAMADAMGLPLGTYARYESGYKRPYLPVEFTRKAAAILAARGIDASRVMLLAGLSNGEAKPEAIAIASRAPSIQFVQMAVAMPSAAALTQMFDALLRGFDEGLPRAELAQGLAQRLPVALAQLQGPLIEMDEEPATLPADAAPPPAKARRARPSQPSK